MRGGGNGRSQWGRREVMKLDGCVGSMHVLYSVECSVVE